MDLQQALDYDYINNILDFHGIEIKDYRCMVCGVRLEVQESVCSDCLTKGD